MTVNGNSSSMSSEPAPMPADCHTRPLLRRLLHWGPLLAIGIIGEISTATMICHFAWWPPLRDVGAMCNLVVFLAFVFLTLSNLIAAASVGPGLVPLKWQPADKESCQRLQYCVVCEGYKPPRSHHCRKCNRCCMKMDHHCPWINNCTGHFNQFYFIKFLFFAVVGCTHALCILGPSIYRAIFRVWYILYGTGLEPLVELDFGGLLAAIFAFGLAAGVVCSVGFLLFTQIRTVWRNRTGIEDYILAKADARFERSELSEPFRYPYDLGVKENMKQVFAMDYAAFTDGSWYPVIEGCDQYTFSEEQIAQKETKRQLARTYIAVRDYNGSSVSPFLCCTIGAAACCCQPCIEDQKMSVDQEQLIKVTRGYKYWLYGEKLSTEVDDDGDVREELVRRRGERGWFPRRVVRRLSDVTNETPKKKDD